MKTQKSRISSFFSITLSLIAIIIMTSSSQGPKQWKLSDDKVNHLLAGEVCDKIGLMEKTTGFKRMGVLNWTKAEQIFCWTIKTSTTGQSDISILINTPQKNTILVLSSNAETIELKSLEKGWHRINTKLQLSSGKDEIKLQLKESLTNDQTAEIIGIEVITATHFPLYQKQLAGFKNDLGDNSWFQEAGYGIMFQWGSWGYPKEGERKTPWNKIYEEFDIEAFANKMAKLDPGYIVWSISWRGSHFAIPLKSVDDITNSTDYSMDYDFTGQLIDALNKRDIPVIFYYHPGHAEAEYWDKVGDGLTDREKYANSNIAIWTEIGNRYGSRLAGWFIDGSMVIHYPTDFYAYTKALKTDNPQRLVSYNPWKFPNCTPFEDMSMGEGHIDGEVENGRLVSGPSKGLMPHYMFVFDGPDWGVFKPNTIINKPKMDLNTLQDKVIQAKNNKSPISIDILMYEDGTLSKETESILKDLKR